MTGTVMADTVMAGRPPWTLRARLILGIVVLLAAVSVIIGTVSILALQASLVATLDSQLTAASSRSQGVVDRPDSPRDFDETRPQPGDFLPIAGLPPGTIGAFIRNDSINGAILSDSLESTALTITQADLLLAVPSDGRPTTVDLGGDLGEYRVIVTGSSGGASMLIGMPLADVRSTVLQLLLVIAGVTALGLAVTALVGTAVVRVALRPLDRVAATAAHVAELPLERGAVALAVRVPEQDADPRTEVGQVGAAINRMLGHIASALTAREASEQKLRTFVADASHELRTPLASIRGYSELTRRGGHDLPADVTHSLGRIESESVRMTSLVEDLLLLARLDDGRSLERVPVDLGRLLADAVSDAMAAGQDHEWELEAPESPVMVLGDAARLHQVIANVLSNARVHTPDGTRVVASVVAPVVLDGEPCAEIVIADNGPGVDEAVLPSVFERFARGDSSRSRAAGSTGLGLAIVAAIVDAHGGTVRVESAVGSTAFRVLLPLAPTAP